MMKVLLDALKRADRKIDSLMEHGMTAAKAEAIVFNGDELTMEQAELLYTHTSIYRDTTDGYVIDESIREADILGVDVVYLKDRTGAIENMALLMEKGFTHIAPTTLRMYTVSDRFYEVFVLRMEKD